MTTRSFPQDFVQDQRGTVAILWAMALIAILGFFAITWDIGRLNASHSDVQSFVDSVALAAAGELDGHSGAISRAKAAATAVIASDTQSFADGGHTLSVNETTVNFTFYSAIPASDQTALDSNKITTDDSEARFVHVTLQDNATKTVTMGFANALDKALGGDGFNADDVNAEAVAGFTQAACDVSPLMFCLPTNWETTLDIGDQVLLKSGGSTTWGPGNFGFIDLSSFKDSSGVCSGKSGNELACLIAAQRQMTRCAMINGLNTEPGQKVGITSSAFNVRFDIYGKVMNGEKNDADFAPAPNVIKMQTGKGNACINGNAEVLKDSDGNPLVEKLGRDLCLDAGTCGRFGDGIWDRAGYLNTNHDLADGIDDGIGSDTHLPALTGDDTIYAGTRYGMYLREIAYGDSTPYGQPNPNAILDPSLPQTGRPMCSNKMSDDPERRVVIAAGVDCTKTEIKGSATGVPVTRFVAFFLTEPVGPLDEDEKTATTFDIYGEVVGFPDVEDGAAESGFGGMFRDVIQLYR